MLTNQLMNATNLLILAFTVKGYGIGSRQADNTTHQVKKLTEENQKFHRKFQLTIDSKSLKIWNTLD